jgi:non-homologous end joining protein Ku
MTEAKSHRAWRGAIEFAGFPVNVALYGRVRKQRNQSFRQIAPSGQPQKSAWPIDSATGEQFDPELTRKGVELGKDQWAVIPPEALEQINSGVKTTVAEPAGFAPLDSIALDLAIDRFAVRADDQVPGSAKAVNIVWNGLRASGLAYVSQVSLGGGHDAILVLYVADDDDFRGVLLPFVHELYGVPGHEFAEDEKAASLFAQVLEAQHEPAPFDHGAFVSEYATRRQAAISAVLAGETIEVRETVPAADEAPDLMAALSAALEAGKGAPKKKKAKATKKDEVTA